MFFFVESFTQKKSASFIPAQKFESNTIFHSSFFVKWYQFKIEYDISGLRELFWLTRLFSCSCWNVESWEPFLVPMIEKSDFMCTQSEN